MEDKLYKAWQSAGKYYDLPDYDTFKEDMKDEGKLHRFHESLGKYYDVPDYDTFKADMGFSTAAEQQPTGQTGAAPAGQTTSAGEMVGQGAQQEQPAVEPSASKTRAQAKPAAVQQAAPVYTYTYFDESAIDPNEGELRMSKTPAGWKYSERVNKSRGSHTKDNSPILRMSLNGDQLDANTEREALAELKDMSDEDIYAYTNGLYNLAWDSLTNEQRREAASRLAAAGQELHARDLGLDHYGDAYRRENAWRTILQDPEYRELYDRGQWADPVSTLSKQYDRLFAEQATGGTMGQQQATKIANRVLRAADKDQMFTWALQEAERTGGDPYKIYENIYDRFHAAVKDKLGAYNTRGQAAGLLGDIDAMIAEKWRAAEEADRSRGYNFFQMFVNAENPGNRVADRLMNDPDMWALEYAKRTIEGVNNMIAEADHNAASGNFGAWLESSFAGGAARGFGQAVFDVRTWDMGFGDVRDATALMTALDKSDKGQPLTKAEQAMLDAKAVELAANAYFKSQVGYGYEAGKVTGESLPFMLEMMINPASKTGGLAVNKLVRYALKRFPQRGAAAVERQAVRAAGRQAVRSAERSVSRSLKGKILESAGLIIETAGKKTAAGKAVRAAVKTAGNVAGSAVMAGTTGLPGVISDTENRMIGQLDYDTDESGKVHVTGHGFGVPMITAFKQALVARGIENVTEMSEFDVLSNWLGGLTRKTLDKLHMSDVYKFFDDIKMSDVAKVVQDFEERTHWQGTLGEYLEEVEGGILNAWLVGDQTLDQDPETGVFNVDNNVKTFLGVSLLGGAFSAVQTVGYRTPKARMRKDIEDADKQASELWGGTWQQFKNSVDAADDKEMEVLLANIVVNGNYSVDQRRAAAQYIKSVVTYRGAMKGEEIRAVDGESNPEDEQSYEQGYQVQGREREQVQDDLQRAEQRLDELGFDLSSFDGWTSDAFERRIASGEHDYTDEDIEAIREYFRAKAASDGMQQRVEDDIDTQVQQASDLVDKQTNQGTGMVHRAVLNEQHGSQEVFVTGGQLVMTGDGTMIDTEASDQSLFVYNPATGQPEQYNPSDFQSVDDPVNPEQLKSEAAHDIRQAVEQQAEADMNGYVQQGESYDMVDEQGNALHGTVLELRTDNTALVQVDGEQIPLAVPTQQLQTWVDNAKQARMSVEPTSLPTRSAGARDNTAPKAARNAAIPRQTNAVAPAAQPPALPMDEKTGEPVWNKTTPEQGYNHLTQSGMTADDIGTMIDDRIAQADAAIAKASKGGTIDQRLQARQAKDYWEAVKALHDAAQSAAIPQQAGVNSRGTTASQVTGTTAQQSPTGRPTTTGQPAPAGTVRVEANQAETMPVGYTAVNIEGTRADDRGQLGIRPEDEAYFLKTMNPRMMGLLNKVAKSLGWKIRLYNGVNSQERGLYNDGVVWVNRRAMTSKLAQWILGHEMTHGMGSRTRRGETFKDYKAMATAYHRSQVGDEQYEREVASLIKAYQDHLRSLGMDTSVVTREYVEEEIACDVTGDLLMNNPEMIGKLFSGVESPSKLKRIIDMIVDALDWIKKKLPFRSEEKQAFDDLIQRLNNLYRDAKAQTDIAKATAREEGSRIESGEGEREGSSFSITGNAEGSGFTASETVLEIWRVPQEGGTYKEEEHWVKKPLLDNEGNVVFRMGNKEFSGKNPITVDDLKSNPDTVLNYMLADALNAGTIDETKADQVRQQYADMLNLYLEKGMATDDGNGFENLEKKWLWVGETVYRTVASNSDEQYSYSMDITKVCKKNEAVIRAISAMQVKTGYGVTPSQILEIYETTDAEGFQVPCPVCYVFSRYINNGKYATAIVNGMKKYGKYLPGQPDAWPVEKWVEAKQEAEANAKKMETAIKHANDDVKVILQQIDALCREITSGKLSKEEAESKRRHVRALDQRYRAALDVISQEALPRWIKAFVIEGSDQGGWSLREDAALPEDMDDFTLHALDIRKTASAMEKYPALTRYRRAGGSAGGKEITFASNNELGTIAMGLGISKDKLDDYPNYYQLAAEAATDEERQALLQKARERFEKAMLYVQRQTLRGGQRMWSWSDNIESLSSDVASNLMQLELLGGALQTYSKQLEGVKMVAAMNGYVNASLMGYGDGVREVGSDDIIEVGPDKKRYLKNDIRDVNNKGRERIIANGYDPETRTGTPVYHNEADGKDYVLVFDDVVGIDPFGHGGKRGLFSLNEEYDRAGNILVGMNDIHVRAAMADPRVFFIIPWHASGMSNHILKQMFNILGVNMDQFVSTDYTKMQEETNYLLKKKDGSPKKKVPKEVEDFWDSHTFEDEFACGTGHIENGDRDGGLSDSQKHYRALRDAIFDGAVKEDTEEYDQIMADEFLSQVYRQVTTRVADGKMTEKDKEFIYPYEYWQMTEVDENGNEVPARVKNADVNGRRYVEYCRRMGFKPKFTGKYDDKTGYSPEGNFADDPGYWKLLIDRRMYDRRGNYQDLTPVDSSGLDSSMYDPDQTSEEFNVTEVATNEGAEKIADIVYQRDADRTGSMPAPNLDMTMDEAVSRYKEVTALQASLIKAEREALTAADVAKQKVEKANTLKAQDSDGRKAKSVARAQESARKAMEVAKQKAREVDEIAGKLGTVRDIIAQYGTTPTDEARFSLNTGDAAELGDAGIRFSIRTKPAPKKTQKVYKLMRLGDDGKLYPLFIDAADAIELGVWYDADSPNLGDLKSLSSDVYTGTRTREENGEKITEEYRYGAYLINNETGEAMSLEEFKQAHKGEKAYRRMGNNPNKEAINYATANNMRWVKIEQKNTGQRRYGGEARSYYNYGINGAKNGGAVGLFAMRPGWHAGSLPTMRQIGKGSGRNLRDDRFVWVEGVVSADVDYNAEAQGNPDKDIPDRIPEDGYYLKSTNANADAAQADRVGWYVAGAFKPERIIGDREAREIIDQWNAEHPDDEPVEYDFPRESGKVFNAETMQLEDDDNGPDGPNGGKRFSIDDAAYAEAVEAGDRKKVARMVKDAVKAAMPNTKAVDRWGKPRLLYHGTPQENQFYEFNGTIYLSSNRSVANEYTHYRRTFGANPRQTGRIMPVFVNLENPLEIDANRHLWRNIDVDWSDTPVTTRDIEQYAKDNGYDGVIIRRVRDNMYDNDTTAADVYIAFSPEQVKSAGPTYEQKKRSHFPWDDYMELDGEVGATYDDDGNLIPLSQRFDMGKRDIRYSLDAAVAEAEQMTETNPTDGQKESGNYKKGHVKVDGFDISIEQPKGSVRSGVDADGKEWSQEMHNTYGYIRGTEGVDGDHIDVFLSDHLDDWNGNVYVVDQVNKDGSFDEHKVMYGFNSEQEARYAYLSNYDEGWTGLGNITGVSREEFKKWVDSSHRKNKPFAEYKNVKPLQSTGTEDRARFSISERTDEAGNEVYTETREDGTKDREVVTWFDEAGRKKEVLSYYPNGEVRQVSNYDSDGDLTRQIQYDENRRAIRHWEPRIGTDWERDENGVARGMSNGVEMRPYGSRFSLAPTFYSNAARAVEGVKQEKAKAEQWKAMLTKAGGIKAGEDKWMGLSTWLDEHKGETLTKDEVAQFVRDNAVQMKETHYGEIDDDIIEEKLTPFEDEFNRLMDEAQDATDSIFTSEWGEWAYNQMREHYGDDFEMAFALTETINGYPAIVPNRNFDGALDDAAKYFLGLGSYGDMEDINATRLDFTTPGLKNKREIAFVVPDVEPYQEYDKIHFGPENQGRAIMWVRFGETTDTDGNRVLVIDEVQSNRHQDAREKGYRSNEDYKNVQSFRAKLSKEHPEGWSVDNESARKSGLYILSKEEHEELMRLNSKAYGGENRDGIPAAPFERNWHEVAMKRMLRLAAEEGFDKVAWTTGMQQAERYNLGQVVDSIEARNYNERNRKDYNGLQRQITIYTANGETALYVTADGYIYDVEGQGLGVQLEGNTLDNVVGKDLASRLMIDEDVTLSGDGLNVGGEGMRAFYDGILPQFMNKYGKRWGVKTGEVTLDTPGKEVMHSVDVNEDMKRSVMQGQPLFSLSAEQQERQTHSDNFKNWFGDWENDPEHASKVVDAEGRPLVVYRGGKKINTFEPDKASRMAMYGPAFYATPSYVDAQEFGKGRTGNADDVQAVYLDIRNPWVDGPCESLGYPKEATMEQARELVDLLTSKGLVDGGIILAKLNDGRVRSLLGALADAEYEGVERGRGEWWHASAIVQDALKELGYDGVVGRFDIGDGHMVEQVAAFEPTQIKSATENNGEFDPGNPDIRFSISEESQKIFDTAKRKFGETKDIREAGYVLPDGVMLDFSGRHELDPGTDSSFLAGRRATDHRAINQISFIYDENGDEVDTGVSSDMPDFIRRGAIRIDNNAGSINLSAAPTMAQRRVLRELIRRNGGDVQVDFGDGWNSDHYVEYEEASAQRVLGDIDRYFDEGIKPESNARFSLSGDGTVEAYNKAVNMTGRTFNVGGREVKPGITRYNFQEAFQDAILAVKKLQQVVERHFGIKLPTRENAWMYENRLSSINMHERKSFIDKVYEPMMKIADAIMKRGVKEKELNAYLICKHGLERNQVFAQRDANEEANEIARNGGTPDMQQLMDKYRQRDYSGLTGVTGIQGDITDIEAEAQRIVDEFEQRHGQLCNELWDAIRKATQWSLRKSYQSGMMSAATFDHVRNMFQYYVPLRGWSETTAEDVYNYMMGEYGAFNGVLKKAEGRTSVADDPLATIGNMAESALMQGNKNLLKQHLLRMAQNHPTDVCQVRDVWLVEGPGGVWEPHWPNIPDDATPDEIDQILQDHEADMQQLEASGQAKRVRNNLDIPYRIDQRHVPEHAVVAKVAGIDHVVYINGNPRAAQAINGQTGAGRGTKSGFSRLIDFIFGDVKRFYSSVLTSLNINFSGANFVRDLPHAYAMTFMKQGPLKAAEYIAKSFQVIPWVFKNQLGRTGTSQMDRYFQEFLASGAVTGYAHINDVDAWKANNKRRFARLSALGKARVAVPRALGEVVNAIGWFSETLELIPRFTAFLTERQAGKDIATATKAAKDITTNFNKKGSEVTPGVWGAVANTLRYMKMFFNPIVQGMYQFVDVASQGKENKMVGPRMVLATLHLPVLGALVPYLNQFLLEALGGDDDDDYWLINEYTRRNNVCIFTGNGYLKIPIAPVFRELYGMGEVVATRHAGKADNEKTTIDLIDQLRTMGSVEGQSSYNEWSLARFLLPEHFAPLIDVMNNENFTGGPIYYDNNYKEYAPEYTKAKKSTWSPLVAASKWLNEMMGGDEDIAADNSGKWLNPAVWQHLITNVGGGFAQLAGDVVAGVTDITEGKEIDPSNIPVMKRFYSGSSDERANWARFGIYKGYEKDYTMAKEKYQALNKRDLSLTERADEVAKFAESHPKAAAIYAVWEGGIKGADIPARLEKLGKDDPKYWDLVKEAVDKAEKAMNSGYVRAWEQKRKDRPDSMSDKELNERFDKSDNDSIRHIMADEISKRAGSQDYYGRDAQAAWSDKSVAAWEAYQDQRTSDDIKADAELSNLLKVDEGEKDKERIKMLGYIKDELNKIRRGKDATSRSTGVKGLGEGDGQRVMNELRAARKQLIEDLKNGSSEQAYRNLERRTMRLGLRKKAKEL